MDAVPVDRLAEAEAAMRALADPVLLALLSAPPEDEDLSPDELAVLEEAESERAAGAVPLVTDDELARRIGG